MPTSLNKYLDPAALDETVVNIRQLTEALEEEMQNLPYALPDGLYPDMTVGAVIGADETAQWATRESTGSGAATVRSVQGAAIGYNQLVVNGNFASMDSIGITYGTGTVADNVLTATANSDTVPILRYTSQLVSAHKCLVRISVKPSETISGLSIYPAGIIVNNLAGGEWTTISQIVTLPADVSNKSVHFNYNNANSGKSTQFRNFCIFDLTAMFGSGNEPATVAEFEAMYPEPYYPYSAPTLKPVRIAGIESTDAQGGELDAIEWTAQTLWGAGTIGDMLYSDHKVTKMATLDMVTLTWQKHATKTGVFYAAMAGTGGKGVAGTAEIPNCRCIPYTAASYNDVMGSSQFDNVYTYASTTNYLYLKDTSKDSMTAAEFKALLSGVTLVYELATPTTTPISPLPMTYRVEQGGSEAIIVPDGEVSAAPVITVAEPVNAGDEFARIWAAIQSLGYTRNTAQLSRPVSLTDIGSIDEVQDNTTEIETIKEVKE